jgi:hypothetical protein
MDPDPELVEKLIQMTDHAFPEVRAFGLAAVQANDWFWRSLFSSGRIRKNFIPYAVDGIQAFHILDLPDSYDEYLSQFDGKKRYNLRRQQRILREHGGGRLELKRVECPDEVDYYLDAVSSIPAQDARSPRGGKQHHGDATQRNRLRSAAERGLLKAYVLTCGDQVIGCVRGSQYLDTFYIDSMPYRLAHSGFSVGATMLLMAIEDLIEHCSAKRINFGFGDPDPTHHRNNTVMQCASVLLLRKTAMNRVARLVHLSFRSAVGSLRNLRERSQPSQFLRLACLKYKRVAASI